MRAREAALQVLRRFSEGAAVGTDCATPVRQRTQDTPISCDKPCDKAPGERHQPQAADHDLAELLGLAGSRQQFLDAVDLVAYFSDEPWPESAALRDLAAWWHRDIGDLTPVDWIISAACADEVRGEGRR